MSDTEKKLTELVIRDLLKELSEETDALHVRTAAFKQVLGDEVVQVQIIITRDASDFLDDFQTEVMHRFEG